MNPSPRFRVVIDSETKADYMAVEQLYKPLFPSQPIAKLIKALRKTPTFNQKASIVARVKGQVVGHAMFSSLTFTDGDVTTKNAAFLAPIAVNPDFQHQQIGTKLITSACQKAAELGYDSLYVVGDLAYYEQLGFELATTATLPSELSHSLPLLVKWFNPQPQCGTISFSLETAHFTFLETLNK